MPDQTPVSPSVLETDYLIVGSGAMGMAFADTLVAESDARVVIVDRHAAPGGHWNDAYSFVRLHTPSAFYGVNSRPLGENRRLTSGVNAGFYEVASAQEIRRYYADVMEETLLRSGRVRYFPGCSYRGDFEREHRFASDASGEIFRVQVRKKVVDATYTDTALPSTHEPNFRVADGVCCVPINALPELARDQERFVVIGAGKTGIDACLWLLEQGVAPERIRWVKPREAWLQDRAHFQPGELSLGLLASFAAAAEAAADAHSQADLFARLSAAGVLLRVDQEVEPTMYRCASVSQPELTQLRSIRDVVRLGRVRSLEHDRIELERGSVTARGGELYVHCAAGGISRRPARPVFSAERITLQSIRWCYPVFSAAIIAHLEATRSDLTQQNALSTPIPYPETDRDWLRVFLGHTLADATARADPELRAWTMRCRLNPSVQVAAHSHGDDPAWSQASKKLREHLPRALERVKQLASSD
ncbi:MAG: NAD(P)-binding protein [Myxococcales bacterium]